MDEITNLLEGDAFQAQTLVRAVDAIHAKRGLLEKALPYAKSVVEALGSADRCAYISHRAYGMLESIFPGGLIIDRSTGWEDRPVVTIESAVGGSNYVQRLKARAEDGDNPHMIEALRNLKYICGVWAWMYNEALNSKHPCDWSKIKISSDGQRGDRDAGVLEKYGFTTKIDHKPGFDAGMGEWGGETKTITTIAREAYALPPPAN